MTPPLRPHESMAIKDYDALAGLTIMVTGAARSLGAAFSDYFEDRGATVWRTDIEASEGVHRLDVTSRAEWEASVNEALAEHGRIDGLVNNAGVFYGHRHFWDEADEELDHMINVNLKGTLGRHPGGQQAHGRWRASRQHREPVVDVGVMATKGLRRLRHDPMGRPWLHQARSGRSCRTPDSGQFAASARGQGHRDDPRLGNRPQA